MFTTQQKYSIANIVRIFTNEFMPTPDIGQKILVKEIFESKLQIPFTHESVNSIPNYGIMVAIDNLKGLNGVSKTKFYEIIDVLRNAIEENPRYSEKIKREAKTYAYSIMASICL